MKFNPDTNSSESESPLRTLRLKFVIPAIMSLFLLVLIYWWGRIPWTWSPVDDAGHVTALDEFVYLHGMLSGSLTYMLHLFHVDLEWGLFRPSYWVYPGLVYHVSPESAHVFRLLLAFVAIGGPLVYFRRCGLRGAQFLFATAMLAAAGSSLYVGLFLISLQELSGAAFIGLGLALKNRWLRLIAWTISAWFKAPFAWMLIGQAIVDWREGRRALAVSNGVTGVGTLGIAVVMARSGGYTSSYGFDPFMIWHNLQVLLEPMNSLLLVSLVWWLLVTKMQLRLGLSSLGFLIGWLGYTTQLLPWSVSAYYMGPISYLLGIFLISSLGSQQTLMSNSRKVLGLFVPVVIAAVLVSSPLQFGFQLQNAMKTFQDCLIERPGKDSTLQGHLVYLTTSPEGAIRLEQNLRLLDPAWTGTITLIDTQMEESLGGSTELLLHVGPEPNTTGEPLVLECEGPNAQVYRNTAY